MDSIKNNAASPVARLANWTLLERTLKSGLGITLDRNEKAMIVAGDTQVLLALYTKVFQKSQAGYKNGKGGGRGGGVGGGSKIGNADALSAIAFDDFSGGSKNGGGNGGGGKRGSKKNGGGRSGLPASDDEEIMSVRIGEMKVMKAQLDEVEKKPKGSLGSYTSSTTFLLASMVQRLSIRPLQAAALLDTNRRYLTHILMHGIKGSYESVLRWMQYIAKNVDAFGAVLVRDVKTAPVDKMRRGMRSIEQGFTIGYTILSALQPGILSHSSEVAKKTCEILAALGAALSRAKLDRVGWRWFVATGNDSGLLACVACMKRHLDSKNQVANVIDCFSRGRLSSLFAIHLRAVMPSPLSYMALAHDLLEPMAANRECMDALVREGVIDLIIGLALRHGEPQLAPDVRGTALSLLCEVWLLIPQEIEMGARADVPKAILTLLKKAARDASLSLQIGALTNLFQLLGGFANEAHSYAPYIYKTLIFSLIENHSNEVAREFIVCNIIQTLESMPHVPVGVVVEPVVKQASLHGYNNLDFDFFISLSKHPRLTVRHGLMTLDLLGKICLNDPLFGRVGTVPFLILAKRFGDVEVVQEYIERFAKVALSMFMHIETRPDAHPELGRRRNEEAANIIHIRRTLVMEVIAKIAHLRNPEYNARMRPLLLTVGEQHARLQGGKMSRAIVALISMCNSSGDGSSSLLDAAAQRGGVEDDLELESVVDEEEEDEELEDDEDEDGYRYDDDRVEDDEEDDEEDDGEESKEDTPSVASDDRDYRDAPDLMETPPRGGGRDRGRKGGGRNEGGGRGGGRGEKASSSSSSSGSKFGGGDDSQKKKRSTAEERRRAMEEARLARFAGKNKKKNGKDVGDIDDDELREILKKTKTDRTVKGDIERAKALKIARERQAVLEARRKRMKSQETRKKMRKQFERKQVARKRQYRRNQADKDTGRNQGGMFGRTSKGDRHGGTFHERQAAMLKLHLESKEEHAAKRAKQTKWVEESLNLFKEWIHPLKYIFKNYSKDFVSTRARTKDFTALGELQSGLTVGDWMILCKDFRLVPVLMDKTQSLALFHLSNTELGVQDTELGARGGQQILSFNEFVSACRGIAMGEAFRSLPTMKERVIALGSFMRRQAYFFGPQKKSRPTDRFKGETGNLQRRMGTCAVWEKKAPLTEYVYMVPLSLKLPDSIRIAMEMVDYIMSAAPLHIHTLTLCPVEIEPSEEDPEEVWEPKQWKPMDENVEKRLFSDAIKGQKPPPPPKKKTSGFGGSFVAPEKVERVKKKTGKRRFGERTIGKLPLRHVKPAKMVISLIAELADACVTGRARKRLEEVYDCEDIKGGEALQNAPRKKGVSKRKLVCFAPARQKKITKKKDLHPKESEKADVRLERERMLALRRREADKIKLKHRQEELRLIIDAQKKAKQAKIDADIKAKKLNDSQTADKRKAKADKKKSDDKDRRDQIEKWRMEKKKGEEDAKKMKNKRVKVKKK